MQTYSHLIVTGALQRPLDRLARHRPHLLPPLRTRALLLGSVLPDLPLIALSLVALLRDLFTGIFSRVDFSAIPPGTPPPPELLDASMTMRLFDVWFFQDPWVITAYNAFHSPLLVIIYIAVGYAAWRLDRRWGGWFFWLSCAAMLHTLADIPLHVTDGPLPLFPLNWTWRFHSPLSYWDPQYHGREWSLFEHTLDVALLLLLLARNWRRIRDWRQHVMRRGVAS
ncbi:MAG: metal-dependent hydrolase [Ardenticatenales bacterium]|nr:metal-dependent hydrolase [Ardenticatenales bacterium]